MYTSSWKSNNGKLLISVMYNNEDKISEISLTVLEGYLTFYDMATAIFKTYKDKGESKIACMINEDWPNKERRVISVFSISMKDCFEDALVEIAKAMEINSF